MQQPTSSPLETLWDLHPNQQGYCALCSERWPCTTILEVELLAAQLDQALSQYRPNVRIEVPTSASIGAKTWDHLRAAEQATGLRWGPLPPREEGLYALWRIGDTLPTQRWFSPALTEHPTLIRQTWPGRLWLGPIRSQAA